MFIRSIADSSYIFLFLYNNNELYVNINMYSVLNVFTVGPRPRLLSTACYSKY